MAMGVSNGEFAEAKNTFVTLSVYSRSTQREITGVLADIQGVKGGQGYDRNKTIWYNIFCDISRIKGSSIPDIWIISPPDNLIEHVNIFHPRYCSNIGKDLPYVCWGSANKSIWSNRVPIYNKGLYMLLSMANTLLMKQNFDSAAR